MNLPGSRIPSEELVILRTGDGNPAHGIKAQSSDFLCWTGQRDRWFFFQAGGGRRINLAGMKAVIQLFQTGTFWGRWGPEGASTWLSINSSRVRQTHGEDEQKRQESGGEFKTVFVHWFVFYFDF